MDDRVAEDIILRTPGGYIGHNKYDPTKPYPVKEESFAQTFSALYPLRPNFNTYAECSGRGTCDYATGECKCFDGFEGRGCRRTSCPNDCSGHGRCLDNHKVNSNYYSYNYQNDQMADQMRTQSCVCDRGFTGYDCASRVCPFGDDPTSDCGENSAGDVQLIVVKSNKDFSAANQFFTLTFTDMFGGKYTTRPILDRGLGGAGNPMPEIQYALMDLPNFAIPEVEVDYLSAKTTGSTTTSLYTVQFTHSSNAGKQNTLQCELITNPDANGAQPKYNPVNDCKVYNVGVPEWFNEDGSARSLDLTALGGDTITMATVKVSGTAATTYEDFQPCSSKGDCDSATGTCTCNSGHFGEACEKQSTYY